jgi:NSS family neurotransmitter:Na+ symporter
LAVEKPRRERGQFGHLGFAVAAAGSAVGLGNIWKFPYITYENHGGSFVLIYLAAVLLVGAPIMIAEIVIGRSTQKSPVGAFLRLGHPAWSAVGWLGISTGFIILSYYSVVAGWTVRYFIKCLGWSFHGFTQADGATLGDQFSSFVSNGKLQVLYHGLFMAVTVGVVLFGVKKGIERATKTLMPALFVMLVILLINSARTPGFHEAIAFLFKPSSIGPDGVLEAVGHSFFTLSLGMGAMITYGSYMSKDESIPKSAIAVCAADTLIALMACVIMFSIIFTVPAAERDTQFSQSLAILFTTLPKMFYSLPGGAVLSPIFYTLVAFAALTSTISLLEVVTSYFIDELNWPRRSATILVGVLIFSFGVLSALSQGSVGLLSEWTPLGDKSQGVFDTLDYVASNWFLPVGGLFIAVFVGWFLTGAFTRKETEEGHGAFALHGLWRVVIRFVSPAAIGWVIYAVILGKKFN